MSNPDALERFRLGVSKFEAVEKKIHGRRFRAIDARELAEVTLDLDAAIPGLEGVQLGRALVLRASAAYWHQFVKAFATRIAVYDPFEMECVRKAVLPDARRGRKLLVDANETRDVAWADRVIKEVSGM